MGLFSRFFRWFTVPRAKPVARDASVAPRAKPIARARAVQQEAASLSLDLRCLEGLNRSRPGPDGLIAPERVRQLAARVVKLGATETRLPAFPIVAVQVVELVQRGVPNINDLVRLVNQDAALTAHLLRIANSAFFGRGVEITSVRDAITRMGLRDLADIASSAAAVALLTDPLQDAGNAFVEERRRLAIHSLASALGASWFAMEHRGNSQQSFLDGLLHDVGKTRGLLAMANLHASGEMLPGEVDAALGLVLDATHVELGVSLARAWKLPEHVVTVCAEHHAPLGGSRNRDVHIARLTSGLVQVWITDWRQVLLKRHHEVDESAACLGLNRQHLTAALTQMKGFVAKAEALVDAI